MTYHDYDVAWVVAVTRKLCQMRLTLKQVVGAWPGEDGPPCLHRCLLQSASRVRSSGAHSGPRGQELRKSGHWSLKETAPVLLGCANLSSAMSRCRRRRTPSSLHPGLAWSPRILCVCVCVGAAVLTSPAHLCHARKPLQRDALACFGSRSRSFVPGPPTARI